MPQQISNILWGTNNDDNDLSDMEMLLTHEGTEYDIKETTAHYSTIRDENDDSTVNEQPHGTSVVPASDLHYHCTLLG